MKLLRYLAISLWNCYIMKLLRYVTHVGLSNAWGLRCVMLRFVAVSWQQFHCTSPSLPWCIFTLNLPRRVPFSNHNWLELLTSWRFLIVQEEGRNRAGWAAPGRPSRRPSGHGSLWPGLCCPRSAVHHAGLDCAGQQERGNTEQHQQ